MGTLSPEATEMYLIQVIESCMRRGLTARQVVLSFQGNRICWLGGQANWSNITELYAPCLTKNATNSKLST